MSECTNEQSPSQVVGMALGAAVCLTILPSVCLSILPPALAGCEFSGVWGRHWRHGKNNSDFCPSLPCNPAPRTPLLGCPHLPQVPTPKATPTCVRGSASSSAVRAVAWRARAASVITCSREETDFSRACTFRFRARVREF